MEILDRIPTPKSPKSLFSIAATTATCVSLAVLAAHCGGSKGGGDDDNDNDPCSTGDADGIAGGPATELVSVSDTGFTVGGVDSGSTEPNIAFQNLAVVTLTLTNTGTKPHDMVVLCIPTGLPAMCMNPTSCFPNPDDAGATTSGAVTLVPTLQPGQSATVTFTAPIVEGTYGFFSDVAGDNTSVAADGGVSGNLQGEFVLM
jgi:hypothetical protein